MGKNPPKNSLINFYNISRSHSYWGRKPLYSLMNILRDQGPTEMFLDPFCGGGTPIIAALQLRARIIASDINPMAVFLTKTLIQPISLLSLQQAFDTIKDEVAESLLSKYKVLCPSCHRDVYFDYLQWNRQGGADFLEAVKVSCSHCGFDKLTSLTKIAIEAELDWGLQEPGWATRLEPQ